MTVAPFPKSKWGVAVPACIYNLYWLDLALPLPLAEGPATLRRAGLPSFNARLSTKQAHSWVQKIQAHSWVQKIQAHSWVQKIQAHSWVQKQAHSWVQKQAHSWVQTTNSWVQNKHTAGLGCIEGSLNVSTHPLLHIPTHTQSTSLPLYASFPMHTHTHTHTDTHICTHTRTHTRTHTSPHAHPCSQQLALHSYTYSCWKRTLLSCVNNHTSWCCSLKIVLITLEWVSPSPLWSNASRITWSPACGFQIHACRDKYTHINTRANQPKPALAKRKQDNLVSAC